jgi:hypothetical protein
MPVYLFSFLMSAFMYSSCSLNFFASRPKRWADQFVVHHCDGGDLTEILYQAH